MSFINEQTLRDAIAECSQYLQQLERQGRLNMDAPKHLAQVLSLYYAYAQGDKTATLNFLCHDIYELRKIIQVPAYDIDNASPDKREDVQRKLCDMLAARPLALLNYLEQQNTRTLFNLKRRNPTQVSLEQTLIAMLRQFNETLARFSLPPKPIMRFKPALTAETFSFA